MREMKLRILELCPIFLMAYTAYIAEAKPFNRKSVHNIIKWDGKNYEVDYTALQRFWTDLLFKISIPRDDHKEFIEAITVNPDAKI